MSFFWTFISFLFNRIYTRKNRKKKIRRNLKLTSAPRLRPVTGWPTWPTNKQTNVHVPNANTKVKQMLLWKVPFNRDSQPFENTRNIYLCCWWNMKSKSTLSFSKIWTFEPSAELSSILLEPLRFAEHGWK